MEYSIDKIGFFKNIFVCSNMGYKLSFQKNRVVRQLPYLISVFIYLKIGDAIKEIVNSK